MYFSLGVKERREDFFNYDEQLNILMDSLRDDITRMIVIKGLRRTGKSSLISVALNELNMPNIKIDARLLEFATEEYFLETFAKALELSAKRNKKLARILNSLSKVSALSIMGFSVKFERKRLPVFIEIMESLNKIAETNNIKIALVLDEAQYLSTLRGFSKLLAYIYDYHQNIKIVIAGSEVGVLERFLGVGNPKHPLYGRPYIEIEMDRLSEEKSKEFLIKGFKQLGVAVSEIEINEAVSLLDGIIGWLNYYGYYRIKLDHKDAIDRTLNEGKKLVKQELENFLMSRRQARRKYVLILKMLIEPLTWSEIKTGLEIKLGKRIHQQTVTRYLKELMAYGFLIKDKGKYKLADPMLREVIRELR